MALFERRIQYFALYHLREKFVVVVWQVRVVYKSKAGMLSLANYLGTDKPRPARTLESELIGDNHYFNQDYPKWENAKC